MVRTNPPGEQQRGIKENVSTTGNPPMIIEGSTVLHFQLQIDASLAVSISASQ